MFVVVSFFFFFARSWKLHSHTLICVRFVWSKTFRQQKKLEKLNLRPQIGQGHPLNLSISLSGGKETKKDSPSNGERKGKSPALNPSFFMDVWECSVWEAHFLQLVVQPKSVGMRLQLPIEGERPVWLSSDCGLSFPLSRVACECSSKWVVNSI